MRRFRTLLTLLLTLGGLFVAGIAITHAVSMDLPSTFADFSSQDLKVTIANIVRIVIGFVGIIFLLLILYAGWLWMTSRGEKDQIIRAKKMLVAAIIGLLLTLSAFAIATFIVQSLIIAVSPSGTTSTGVCGNGIWPEGSEQCDDGNTISGDGCSALCLIEGGMIPGCNWQAGIPIVCSSSMTAPGSVITVSGYNFLPPSGTAPGILKVNNVDAKLVMCMGSPSWGMGSITAIVATSTPAAPQLGGIFVQRSDNVKCNDVAPTRCGNSSMGQPGFPQLLCLNPNFGATGASYMIEGRDLGTSGVVEMQGPSSMVPVATGAWDGISVAATVPVTAVSGPVRLTRSDGKVSNTLPFRVSCASGANCSGACCLGNSCQLPSACAVTTPVITAVSPNDGEEGNYITITGRNFGNSSTGELHFRGPDGVDYVNIFAPCATAWSDTQIIMEVPEMSSGNTMNTPPATDMWVIQGTRTSNHWVTFQVNDTIRPGLCSVDPSAGEFKTLFGVTGNNFGTGVRELFFGQRSDNQLATGVSWYPNPITLPAPQPPDAADGSVPNLQVGGTTIAVDADGELSNPLHFEIVPPGQGPPQIFSVTPSSGGPGTYVSVLGKNFGNTQGVLQFIRQGAGTIVLGDFSFPQQCGTDYWRNDRIVVKVPGMTNCGVGSPPPSNCYYIRVQNISAPASRQWSANLATLGVNTFTKNSNLPGPGLCKIDPIGGPANGTTYVNYFGESFKAQGASSNTYFDISQPAQSFTNWVDQQVFNALVPSGAVTGSTTVMTRNNEWSNPLPFYVGSCTGPEANNPQCGGLFCCSGLCRSNACNALIGTDDNQWQFTTGQDDFDIQRSFTCSVTTPQSPTPFPYAHYNDYDGFYSGRVPPVVVPSYSASDPNTNAPIDSSIAATFTWPLDFTTIVTPNIRILQCNSGLTFDRFACNTDVTIRGTFGQLGTNGFIWELNATNVHTGDTWYEVQMDYPVGDPTSNITASDGRTKYRGSEFLGSMYVPNNPQVDDFRWHFRTRPTAALQCDIATVRLDPAGAALNPTRIPVNQSRPFTATPQSRQCYLCGGSAPFTWSTPLPAGFVQYTPSNPTVRNVSVDALALSDPQVISFNASTLNRAGATITSNPAYVMTVHERPYVMSMNPTQDCGPVCTNVQIWALFNIDLDPAQLIASRVHLRECTNATCNAFVVNSGPGGDVASAISIGLPTNRMVTITPNVNLNPFTDYRVIIDGTVTNTLGQTMDPARLNYDSATPAGNDSFSWTFQTSGTVCVPTHTSVRPVSALMTQLGSTLDYRARAYLINPSCGEIDLNPFNYGWTWMTPVVTPDPGYVAPITSFTPAAPIVPTTTVTAIGEGNETIRAMITTMPLLTMTDGTLQIKETRDRIDFIGHRPDDPPSFSPAEDVPADGVCQIGLSNPANCPNQCRNVLVSAFFSTYVNQSSLELPRISMPSPVLHMDFNDGTTIDRAGVNTTLALGTTSSQPNSQAPNLGRGMLFHNRQSTSTQISCPNGEDPKDWIEVTDNPVLRVTQSFTLYAWINVLQTNEVHTILSKDGYSSTTRCGTDRTGAYLFSVLPSNTQPGKFRLQYESNNLPMIVHNAQPFEFLPNTWVQAAVTYIETNPVSKLGTITFYVNGAAAGSIANVSSPLPDDGTLFVGRAGVYSSAVTPTKTFAGMIDDVRVYGEALTAEQMAQLYRDTLGVSSNIIVKNSPSGTIVPGQFSVANYTSANGVCTMQPTIACANDTICKAGNPNDTCSHDIGRIDFIPSAMSYADPVPYEAYYSFEAASTQDDSGNDHLALSQGALPRSTDCPNGTTCYVFKGGACKGDASTRCVVTGDCPTGKGPCIGDDIRVAEDSDFNGGTGNALTTSLWFKADDDSLFSNVLAKRAYLIAKHTGQQLWGWGIYLANDIAGNHQVCGYLSGSTVCSNPIQTGTWYHVSMTYVGGSVSLYVNGELDQQAGGFTYASNNTAVSIGGARVFYIGGGDSYCSINIQKACPAGNECSASDGTCLQAEYFFKGAIDDVRFYTRALTAGEAFSLYAVSSGATRPEGAFDPLSGYTIEVCPTVNGVQMCGLQPILSTQGRAYSTNQVWAFGTSEDFCRISFVDILPNPAIFVDRTQQCLDVPPTLECVNSTPFEIFPYAKDASGIEMGMVKYDWRKTIDIAGGTYASPFYQLDQSLTQANTLHKGAIGIDYNMVTATSSSAIPLGTASATGIMEFLFCENPWYGVKGTTPTPYYLDQRYDFKLQYCRDTIKTLLPELPAPHIERQGSPFTFGGDLLKEHVFVVGSDATASTTLTSGSPVITGIAGVQPNYKFGDLVYFSIDAYDPDGDTFLYVMQNPSNPTLPPELPLNSFDQRMGIFEWIIDRLPTADHNGNGINDFPVKITTNPAPAGLPFDVIIDVGTGLPSAPVGIPTVPTMTANAPTGNPPSVSSGAYMLVPYGTTVTFTATTGSGPNDTIRSFAWNFNDSGTSSYPDTSPPSFTATHLFLQPGIHQVTFRAQNIAGGWSDTAVINIQVGARATWRNTLEHFMIGYLQPFYVLARIFTSTVYASGIRL